MLFKLFRALWLGVLTAACVLFILIRSETTSTAPPPALPNALPACSEETADFSAPIVLPIVHVDIPQPQSPAPSLPPIPKP